MCPNAITVFGGHYICQFPFNISRVCTSRCPQHTWRPPCVERQIYRYQWQFCARDFEFNNRGNIVAGSMAQIYLQGKLRQGVLAVPTEALTEAQGLYFVYVQEHADSYRRQEVKIGATDGLRTEIVSGVKAGDKVVTHGATQVRLAASSGAVPEGHSH